MRLIFLTLALFLSSCQKDHDHSYLMQHPDELEQMYKVCQNTPQPFCDTVIQAMQDYVKLFHEASQSPVQFGLKVMRAQQQWVALKQALQNEENNADQILLMARAYEDQSDELKIYYAILSQFFTE